MILKERMRTILCHIKRTRLIRRTCPFKIKEGGTRVFSNGISVLLITRPERKIYLSSPRICDQGISASVLLRDEN